MQTDNLPQAKDEVVIDQSKTVSSIKVRVNKENESEFYLNEIIVCYSDGTKS